MGAQRCGPSDAQRQAGGLGAGLIDGAWAASKKSAFRDDPGDEAGRVHVADVAGLYNLQISVPVLPWLDYDHAEMSQTRDNDSECYLRIEGLRLWLHHRTFPESKGYWDGNWLFETAVCEAAGSVVRVTGSILHTPEIDRFRRDLEKLNERLEGKAELKCIEPHLGIIIEAQSLGHLRMVVAITPDHLNQKHEFVFETDQSWLSYIISDCSKILRQYPIVGATDI